MCPSTLALLCRIRHALLLQQCSAQEHCRPVLGCELLHIEVVPACAGVTRPNRPGIDVDAEPPAVRMNDMLGGILTYKLEVRYECPAVVFISKWMSVGLYSRTTECMMDPDRDGGAVMTSLMREYGREVFLWGAGRERRAPQRRAVRRRPADGAHRGAGGGGAAGRSGRHH